MKYKSRPESKIKNIVIAILSVLLILSWICLFYSVDVTYDPVIDAVTENTQLKERVLELETENDALKNQPTAAPTETPTETPSEVSDEAESSDDEEN